MSPLVRIVRVALVWSGFYVGYLFLISTAQVLVTLTGMLRPFYNLSFYMNDAPRTVPTIGTRTVA